MSKVEDFLSQYSSQITVKNYRTALRHYFKVFYPNLGLDEAVEEYFKTPKIEAEYENDFTKFFITIKDRPPITINVLISIVKQFLLENDVEFSEKFLRRLRRKRSGSGLVSTDRIPTGEELKRIISHMSLCWRAFILVLVSSGMRRGEALSMSLDDLDLTKIPARIHIRAKNTKSRTQRVVFISDEARIHLTEWLKIRPNILRKYAKKRMRAHTDAYIRNL